MHRVQNIWIAGWLRSKVDLRISAQNGFEKLIEVVCWRRTVLIAEDTSLQLKYGSVIYAGVPLISGNTGFVMRYVVVACQR